MKRKVEDGTIVRIEGAAYIAQDICNSSVKMFIYKR